MKSKIISHILQSYSFLQQCFALITTHYLWPVSTALADVVFFIVYLKFNVYILF